MAGDASESLNRPPVRLAAIAVVRLAATLSIIVNGSLLFAAGTLPVIGFFS